MVDIVYYRNFCTTLRALIKSTIVQFSIITNFPEVSNYCYDIDHKTYQLMYYDES